MTLHQAQTFGRAKTLKATAIIAGIFLVVFMFMETSGDFANGILFFMEAVTNIHFIIILGILFGLTFLFGGKAGKEIIIDKRNFVVTSIKYVVLIILTIIIYAATIGIVKDNGSTRNFQELLVTYFLTPLIKTGGLAIIPLLLIWLWSTYQMRLLEVKKKTK
jgi:hypothetical protein